VKQLNTKHKTQTYSEDDIRSLVECNKILKEHLEFLRTKLKKTENLLELYIRAVKEEEEERSLTNYPLN